MIGRNSEFESVWSARVHGYVATNRACRLTGGIGCVQKSTSFHGISNPGIDTTGLNESPTVAIVDLQNSIHSPEPNHDSASDGKHRTTQAGASPTRNNRHMVLSAKGGDFGNLFGRARQNNRIRQILLQC